MDIQLYNKIFHFIYFFHYFFLRCLDRKMKEMLFIGNFVFVVFSVEKNFSTIFFSKERRRRKKSQQKQNKSFVFYFFFAFYLWNCYQGDTSISGVSAHVLWLNISCEKQYLSGNIKDSYERNEQTSAHFKWQNIYLL